MDNFTDWNSVPFGHGLFAQLALSPILYQGLVVDESKCAYHLVADQKVTIGMKIQKPDVFVGTNDDFIAQVRKGIEKAEYGFSVMHETSDVLHETNYRTASQALDTTIIENKTLTVTDSAVTVTFETILHVARQFLNTPLQLRITLRLHQSHGNPLSSRSGMNTAEKNIRQLMDLNRYRPQATPERRIEVPILVSYPLVVESNVREVQSNLSIVAVTVRNSSQKVHIGVHELVIHFDRTNATAVHRSHHTNNNYEMTSNLASLFSLTLMNTAPATGTANNPINKNDNTIGITIAPLEEYTLLYAVTPNDINSGLAQPQGLASCVYHAPCTICWSIADTARNQATVNACSVAPVPNASNENDSERDNTLRRINHSELACSMSWTLGSTFTAIPTPASAAAAVRTQELGEQALALDITIKGPNAVTVDETFELQVCIRNNSAFVVENATLCAPSRNSAELGHYIVHEPETSLGDIPAGAAVACIVRVTAMQLGSLRISDIYVRASSSSSMMGSKYQLKYPFQLLVQERLHTVEL